MRQLVEGFYVILGIKPVQEMALIRYTPFPW